MRLLQVPPTVDLPYEQFRRQHFVCWLESLLLLATSIQSLAEMLYRLLRHELGPYVQGATHQFVLVRHHVFLAGHGFSVQDLLTPSLRLPKTALQLNQYLE